MLRYSRIRFSKEASEGLSKMKGRTGLTPNILCRIGFNMSLNDPNIPNPEHFPADGDREIEKQVLTGPWENMFFALLKEWAIKTNIKDDDLLPYFKAHMNRGVLLLSKRVKSIKDFALLITNE